MIARRKLPAASLSVGLVLALTASADATLVWYSPLDGDADAQVGQFDGVVTGAVPAADRNGSGGRALFFDGVDDVVTIDKAELPSFAQGTFAAWIRPDTIGNYHGIVSVGQSAGGQTEYFEGIVRSGGLRFDVDDGDDGIGRREINVTSGDPGAWRHVALTFTAGQSAEAYLDGAAAGSVSLAGGEATIDPALDWVVGELRGSSGSPVDPFHGAIDDVSIWSRALSSAEVRALADATETPVTLDSALRVDFGATGQDVESAFREFTGESSVASPLLQTFASPLGAAGEVGIEVSAPAGNLGFRFRPPDLNDPLGDLVEDHVKNNGGEVLEVTLTGLARSTYALDAYLNDNEFGSLGQVDIEVDDAWGTGRLVLDGFLQGGPGTGNLAVASFPFQSNGVNPVTIRFIEIPGTRPGGGNQEIALNGITLTAVPEPSSLLLAALGIAGLVIVGRRRRH